VRLALIVNPRAAGGRAGSALEGVRQTLSRLGAEHHAEQTSGLEHARKLARQAAAAGEVAVAFGGDGLVGAVAGALQESGGTLGILPGGRGNDVARALRIPLEPVAACQVLVSGEPRAMDLGEVNSRTFISIASCGFDSDANRIANETRLVRGNLVYAYGALRALGGWQPTTFTVELDGLEPRIVTGYTVAAANTNAYGGGMLLAPNASAHDGLLDVVIVGDASKLRFLRCLPSLFRGTHLSEPNVEVIRAATVRISASRPFTMYADGDPIAELPVTVRVRPDAIQVVVPK
jgi:YegS/Rv2252/BmrU family lipid kinase